MMRPLFEYPEKTGPGKYDVKAWIGGERVRWRFKLERDALRFYHASARAGGGTGQGEVYDSATKTWGKRL